VAESARATRLPSYAPIDGHDPSRKILSALRQSAMRLG
jgi:hypothetical protein